MKVFLLGMAVGLLLLPCAHTSSRAAGYELALNVKNVGAPIQPTMYGLFFEDINFGADGGLYAELVKNRSFEFPQALMGWNTFGKVEVRTDEAPFERNPHYLRLYPAGHAHKHTGVENEGFRGIGIRGNAEYRFSVWARAASPQKIRVELVDADNNPFEKKELTIDSRTWKKYTLTLAPKREEARAKLRIFLASAGEADVEHISLFPTDTWRGRENGLRRDLAEALAELQPGVFRFPGGCIVEGTDLATRYDWKKSVGQVENRPLNENRWHYTFTHRLFPDYFQSYGLGFYEFFLLAEDMGAEPLPVVNCGLACQYQNKNAEAHVHVDSLECYIQDALDLIEFANGSPATTWGKVRAEMGHPEPFNLKYIGVGNEQWGKEYPERLEQFIRAIRKAHPQVKVIGSSGPSPDGKDFDYLWQEMARLKVDLVDEHYYRSPEWFLQQATRYDSYDRKAPKVFAGEYACHPKSRKNSFEAALCESAFMTGLERNADVVHMCTYAPLLAHVDAWQWRPDLIWFDNLRLVRTPSYYVQQLYAAHKGSNVLTLTHNQLPLTGQDGIYASAAMDAGKREIIVKLSNTAAEPRQISIKLEGVSKKMSPQAEVKATTLQGSLEQENTLSQPNSIAPQESVKKLINNTLDINVEPSSFNVYRIAY